MADADPDSEKVSEALARLVAWPEIARSPQLANFLTYIVERRLGGDAQSIKAYSIAVDVFGRPTDFDPQADPIVRVQARRLRALLDQYYRGPGIDDPVRIDLPIGRYVPDFIDSATDPSARPIEREPTVTPDLPPEPRKRGHVTVSWYVLLVLTLGSLALAYSLSTLAQRQQQAPVVANTINMPRLRVMEFQNLTGEPALTPGIAALAAELVTDFGPLLVVDPIFGGRGGSEANSEDQVDFNLTGIVRADTANPEAFQVNAIVTDVSSNSVVWNWSRPVSREQVMSQDGIAAISHELILRLGGTRGPLHDQARDFLARNDPTGQTNPYICGLLFSSYRATPSAGAAARFEKCVAALSEADQQGPNILAGRASVMAETAPLSGAARGERMSEAQAKLAEAMQLAPTSSFVWEQRARLHETLGQHEDAEAAYETALQLNPGNLDGAAARARHLALIGQLDRAVPLAQRAIEAVPPLEVPGWYYCVPAIDAVRKRDLEQARRLAESCGRVDTEVGAMLTLLIARVSGDAEMVAKVLPRILDVSSFRSVGIMTRLRVRSSVEVFLGDIEEALLEAGVPQQNLYAGY